MLKPESRVTGIRVLAPNCSCRSLSPLTCVSAVSHSWGKKTYSDSFMRFRSHLAPSERIFPCTSFLIHSGWREGSGMWDSLSSLSSSSAGVWLGFSLVDEMSAFMVKGDGFSYHLTGLLMMKIDALVMSNWPTKVEVSVLLVYELSEMVIGYFQKASPAFSLLQPHSFRLFDFDFSIFLLLRLGYLLIHKI